MTRSARTVFLVVALVLAAAPAAASAATLNGTVVAVPAVHGTQVVVPVLLGEGSRRTAKLRSPLVRVRTPVAKGLRTRDASVAPGSLRVGDRVRFVTHGKSLHTTVVRILVRGAAPSFATLIAQRDGTQAAATAAVTAAADLDAGRVPSTDPAAIEVARDRLLAVRTRVNLLIAGLRSTAGGFAGTLSQIVAARPAGAARNAAVAKKQAPFLAGISTARDNALTSADTLDGAVSGLDQRIDDLGGVSAPSLPIGTVSTVSDLIQTVLTVAQDIGVVQLPVPGVS